MKDAFPELFDSESPLPPLDSSPAPPENSSSNAPSPVTPADSCMPSWALPPRIPRSSSRIAKRVIREHEDENDDDCECPVDVPQHMLNVFHVHSTGIEDDVKMAVGRKRRAGDDLDDASAVKKRRTDADDAMLFSSTGPLGMFRYDFKLKLDGPSMEVPVYSGASDQLSAAGTSSYDALAAYESSQLDEFSPASSVTVCEDADTALALLQLSFSCAPEQSAVAPPPVQHELYDIATVSCDSYRNLSSYDQHIMSVASADYLGYPVEPDLSACTMSSTPAVSNFVGQCPPDILTNVAPITRWPGEHERHANVPGLGLYPVEDTSQQQQQQQQQQPTHYLMQSLYAHPQQVYWQQQQYQPQPILYSNGYVYAFDAFYGGYVLQPQEFYAQAYLPAPYQQLQRAAQVPHPYPAPASNTIHYAASSPASVPASTSAQSRARARARPHKSPAAPPQVAAQSPSALREPSFYETSRCIMDGRVVYACSWCDCSFDMPNKLGMHIRWHRTQVQREPGTSAAPAGEQAIARSERQSRLIGTAVPDDSGRTEKSVDYTQDARYTHLMQASLQRQQAHYSAAATNGMLMSMPAPLSAVPVDAYPSTANASAWRQAAQLASMGSTYSGAQEPDASPLALAQHEALLSGWGYPVSDSFVSCS